MASGARRTVTDTRLERGQRNPTLITIYELATVLGVTHVDLVRPTRTWLKAQAKPHSTKCSQKISRR